MRLRAHDITWREIDGDLVVLDLRSATYMTANASGAVILKELAEERTSDELVAALVEAFGISATQAESDVTGFVQVLRDGGLLEEQTV